MFSDLDQAFTALRERAPQPPFEPAAAVRRRGRRRTHRQIGVAAVAVVALLAGAGALVTGPIPTGRVEPAASRSAGPTSPAVARAVPNELLLQPADVPDGFRVGADRDDLVDFPVSVVCVDIALTWESRQHRRAGRWIVFAGAEAMRAKLWLHEEQIQQSVMVFSPGWATRGLAEYGAWVDTCANRSREMFTVLDRGFAGDESVLYRVEQPPEAGFFLAQIRVGDRVTTVRVGAAFQLQTARDLATRAGERLRS